MVARILSFSFKTEPLTTSNVVGFRVERRLGVALEAHVDVVHSEFVDPDELLGRPALLGFGRDAPEHEVHGVIMDVEMASTLDDEMAQGYGYRLRMTSRLGVLSREIDCRIFQDLDVQGIVSAVLRGAGVDDAHQAWRCTGTYPKREYCVQYNETSLAFISRLLEEEGIYFYSETNEKGENLVFEDDSTAGDPIDGDKRLHYRFAAGLSAVEDAIGVITQRHRTASGKVILRDYNFTKPKADMTATANADVDTDLARYDYPGLYTDPSEGERLARVRLEAIQVERAMVEIESGCPRIVPGRWFELVDAPFDLDGEYFITNAIHELRDGVYVVRATVIPRRIRYRTPQHTAKPVIEGPQTAVVVAPPDSPLEYVHTDEHGRCKVQFHWDRYGKMDDSASCWIRTTHPQMSGAIILPRVGWEVIVEFLEGNPDRPIVTGRLFNGRWMPPYALPAGKSRTAFGTRSSPGGNGSNEIRFEDKAGNEEISIRSQKNTTMVTGNNKSKVTGADETKNVGVDASLEVGANQSIQVTNGCLNTVEGGQTVKVAGSRDMAVNAVYGLTATGASATTVGGRHLEMDGSPLDALLSLAAATVKEMAQAQAARVLHQLELTVAAKVNQVVGPIQGLQSQVETISSAMEEVSNGNLGAATKAFDGISKLPLPGAFGMALAGGAGIVAGAADAGPWAAEQATRTGGSDGARDAARGDDREERRGVSAERSDVGDGGASDPLGLNSLMKGAMDVGADRLGEALGMGGEGGGGSSAENMDGPAGGAAGHAGGDSSTGPGHSINVCASTHSESVGGVKATIAAAGIHTTVAGARTQDVRAARIELVAGTRAETCLAGKTERAALNIVVSNAPESQEVGGSRSTTVGGAIVEKVGASYAFTAGGKGLFVGAFHKIDASSAIVFKCGASELVIDGGGVTIKAPLVTVTAPNITLTKSVSEA